MIRFLYEIEVKPSLEILIIFRYALFSQLNFEYCFLAP